MTLRAKSWLLAAVHCGLLLSLTGKLRYDRETRPRVWVKTAPWDPSLPIRGRYLALRLQPQTGAPFYTETDQQQVLFFVPETLTALERQRPAPEIWAEVTIPRSGPPRPIRLGVWKDGRVEPVELN